MNPQGETCKWPVSDRPRPPVGSGLGRCLVLSCSSCPVWPLCTDHRGSGVLSPGHSHPLLPYLPPACAFLILPPLENPSVTIISGVTLGDEVHSRPLLWWLQAGAGLATEVSGGPASLCLRPMNHGRLPGNLSPARPSPQASMTLLPT